MMNTKKLTLLTYGCQMNEYDSERIAGIMKRHNYIVIEDVNEADLILFNTCSIRDKAEQKVFSEIGRLKDLKKRKPETIIGVCGCIAQLRGETLLQRNPHIDLVLGTNNLHKLPEILEKIEKDRSRITYVSVSDDNDFSYNSDEIDRNDKCKAFVSIMKGCSNFCSYCVVPYTRGKEHSRKSADIIHEIETLGSSGYKEVTLIGQNVNSYGKDLKSEIDFPDLLTRISYIKGISRIRFVTSHPKDISDKLIECIASIDKICNHFHIPVQSGSNKILKLMNRGYDIEEYLRKIDKIKKLIPNANFSTDIILGFPGENEEDFLKTKKVVELIEYSLIYLFKFSKRPETKAASFTDIVPDDIVSERFDTIQNIQQEIVLRHNNMMVGNIFELLVEDKSKKGENRFAGRTRGNKIVNFSSETDRIGEMVNVKITRGLLYSLDGELIN